SAGGSYGLRLGADPGGTLARTEILHPDQPPGRAGGRSGGQGRISQALPRSGEPSAVQRGRGLDHAGGCAVSARRRDAGKTGRDGCRTESPAAVIFTTKRTKPTTTKPN